MVDVQGGDDLARNSPWGGPSRRGLKLRKRDDYGVELFRQAIETLADPPRLRHALLELTRAYNPLDDAPILPPSARQTVLALVEAGEVESARGLLESRLDAYARRGQPESAP